MKTIKFLTDNEIGTICGGLYRNPGVQIQGILAGTDLDPNAYAKTVEVEDGIYYNNFGELVQAII